MNALTYCEQNITFAKTSDITGSFDLPRYRFLEKPLSDLSNPRIRRMVIYKASSCMGTVFLQCAMAYRVERELGDIQSVAQTDDDAKEWTVTRGKDFILKIHGVEQLISSDKYAITNGRWMFAHKFVLICGPGVANQNAKQVRFLFTDESHLVESFPDGTLTAFEKRMGNKWNRASLHVTTAADAGREVDVFYHEGGQNEFHLRCLNCRELFWPLWGDDAEKVYGKHIFVWNDNLSGGVESRHAVQNVTILDRDRAADGQNTTSVSAGVTHDPSGSSAPPAQSIRLVCPHCSHEHHDDMQTRYALQTSGDYVSMNQSAPAEYQSYRWNCFAYYPITWKEVLADWLRALAAERQGDLKPMEDFVKKRLCMSYTPTLHALGENANSRDYKLGSVWITGEPLLRTCSFDVQDEGGFHLWAQCDEFKRDGSSRRVQYAKLSTWGHVRQFQLDHLVESEHTGVDIGHRYAETLGRCSQWKWYGFQATNDPQFFHSVRNEQIPNRFYSQAEKHNALIGMRKPERVEIIRGIPDGICLVRKWSKANVGIVLMRLKSGDSGRYFGIASDITEDFTSQLHSYVEALDTNKKTGAESLILRQVKHHDHAFSCSSQSLILAMVAGYFPLSESPCTSP